MLPLFLLALPQILLKYVHHLWVRIVQLIWVLNGTSAKIESAMSGKESAASAHVQRVVWINPTSSHADPESFFTVHERFAPADIVLDSRVHLLSVTSKTATFTEVDSDILDSRKHPFIWSAQVKRCTRLIVLPVQSFFKLVDKIDVEDRKVVWLFHTTRCGSTAWVQAFNSIPGWVAFSAPQALVYSVVHGDHGYNSAESFSKTEEYRRILIAIITMYLRQTPPGCSVLWKAIHLDEHMIYHLVKRFPQHKLLVAYRDVLPVVSSFQRAFGKFVNLCYLAEQLMYRNPSDVKWWSQISNLASFTNGFNHGFCMKVIARVRPRTLIEWSCFTWCAKLTTIQQVQQNGINIQPLKYDGLAENKRATVAKLFEYLDISSDYVDLACEALNYDSQAAAQNDKWKTGNTKEQYQWMKDSELVKRCKMILEEFSFPLLGSSFDLADSI
ncbi:uncharacterized protein [Watersipora subatra]|uniref:uncharacterized protein n=1 Tax=Watersipora subatra TaxID=2589382 RepID=UPI00355B8CB4